jgi:uncharacterized protein
VEISYDLAKDAANRAKHGLSFADFTGFDLWTSAHVDDRSDYGEVRFRAFGRIDGRGYSIAYTETIEGIRLISFRRAHDREMRRYE